MFPLRMNQSHTETESAEVLQNGEERKKKEGLLQSVLRMVTAQEICNMNMIKN